tara:strand:+ start:1974 stop:2660 length:687 start_codon:yes stop_codon:yes gene_type:complete
MNDDDHTGIANLLNLPRTPKKTLKVMPKTDPMMTRSEILMSLGPIKLPETTQEPKDEYGFTKKQNALIEKQLTRPSVNSKGAFKRFANDQKKLDQKIDDSQRYIRGYKENVKYIYNKDRGNFTDRTGNKVRSDLVLAEQQDIEEKIKGAKDLQYISNTTYTYEGTPKNKPRMVYDMNKKDYVDINNPEKKEDFKFENILPLDKKVPNIKEREVRKSEINQSNKHKRIL